MTSPTTGRKWLLETLGLAIALIPAIIAALDLRAQYDFFQRGSSAPKRLVLDESHVSDPLSILSTYGAVVSFTATVREKPVMGLRIATATLSNEGRAPILPEEFHRNLTVSVTPPWKILTIDSPAFGRSISLDWERMSDQEFTAKPFLFNPGDSARISTYISWEGKDSVGDSRPTIRYEARVVNLPTIERKERSSGLDLEDFGPVIVYLTGRSFWGWFFFFSVYFGIYLYLGKQIVGSRGAAVINIPVTIGLGIISAAAAESTSSILFPAPFFSLATLVGSNRPNQLVLAIHIGLTIGYILSARKARRESVPG